MPIASRDGTNLGALGAELLALAGKVSTDLSEIIRENPRELAALLRTTKGMTSDDVARLAQEAEKSKNK